jgi:4-hydroxyacetophenone monooxygenase
MANRGNEAAVLQTAEEPASDTELRAALEEANLPTLLMVLAHLTGDDKWLEDPYRPGRPKGVGDHDSGGFPEMLQRSIRADAFEIIRAWREGRLAPAEHPSPQKLTHMLEVSLGMSLPEGYGGMLAEELGLASRDVEIADPPSTEQVFVLVIGSGFSGLLAAMKLQQAGIAYTLVEKNARVGGTWFENTYPGCGVDTPTHLYSLSFAQRADWSRYFAKRDELSAYLQRVADEAGVEENIRFETEVTSAAWNADDQRWHVEVRTADGGSETLTASVIISGVGFLNRPAFPKIEGLETFEGPTMHTAEWRDDVELEGKRVAVIGTGASAMQLVPNIAGVAERLMVFQRSPQWGMPHPNYMRPVTPATRLLMEEVPYYLGWYRLRQVWNFGDRLHQNVQWDPDWPHADRSISELNDRHREFLTEYIRSELGDRAEELLPKCVPTYPPYGKRPLLDNGWFRTMARDDVDLVTDDVAEIRADRVVTVTGEEFPADVIVLATGFQALRVLAPMEIRGRSGRTLREIWGEDDARAYLGISIPDFPNFFCLLGPNTFAGHGGSGVLSIELELRYVMELLAKMLDRGLASVECRHDVHDDYNARLDEALSHTIWAHPGMTTYYRNSKGRIVVPMPWTNVEYWHMTRDPDLDDYLVVETPR